MGGIMRLKNKKTGEIIDIYKGEITLHYNQGRKTIHFKCLEDLEANVNSLVTNHGFKCRGGVFYDAKTNMYCQALEN